LSEQIGLGLGGAEFPGFSWPIGVNVAEQLLERDRLAAENLFPCVADAVRNRAVGSTGVSPVLRRVTASCPSSGPAGFGNRAITRTGVAANRLLIVGRALIWADTKINVDEHRQMVRSL
jgi:hypothetical protein